MYRTAGTPDTQSNDRAILSLNPLLILLYRKLTKFEQNEQIIGFGVENRFSKNDPLPLQLETRKSLSSSKDYIF